MKSLQLGKHPALEAIQHQTDTRLFKSLALEFSRVLQLDRPNSKDVLSVPLEKLVYQSTGLNVKFLVEPYAGFGAFMSPPTLNRNHSLVVPETKEFMSNDGSLRKLHELKSNKLTGFVDRKRARVSGIFSEVQALVGLNLGCFYRYGDIHFTGEEIAAAVLHELGHLFNWYELMANQLTTNHAIRAAKETFLSTNDKTLRVEILKQIDLSIGGAIADKEMVAQTANSEEALTAVVLKSNIEKLRSELGSSLYDRRGWEYLSDQFAVRMGAGVHLATLSDKMDRLYGHISRRTYVDHLIVQLTGTVLFTLGTLLSIGLLPYILLTSGDPMLRTETSSYDRPGERFARMRRELTDALKNKNLSKILKEQYVQDVETIKKIESTVNDRWSWWESFYGFVVPSARKARNKIAQQQLLEELANNQLYTSAAKLSTLA